MSSMQMVRRRPTTVATLVCAMALWMSQEARDGDEALQPWVAAGPWGIIGLAGKYLPPELASRLPARPE